MVTQQKNTTTVCKPGVCRICDSREAAALGRTAPKTPEQRQAFYLHALDANALRLRQLIDKGADDITAQLRKTFAYGRLAGVPEFFEPELTVNDGLVVL